MKSFADAMLAAGVGVPICGIQADGVLHRFRGAGDKPGNLNCWYLLHLDDRPAGVFGSWRTGVAQTWSGSGRTLSPDEAAELDRKVRQARLKAQAERAHAQRAAAESAQRRWNGSGAGDARHPYLVAKAIPPGDLRQSGAYLLVPLYDIGCELWNLQTIGPNGRKLFSKGGRIKGCFSPIGLDTATPERLLICEGYATGATLQVETGTPVLAAMNAGNLLPVAQAARGRWPDCDITICGDDDRDTEGNPGRTKATQAATAIGGKVVFPTFDLGETGSDFNDMAANRRMAAS